MGEAVNTQNNQILKSGKHINEKEKYKYMLDHDATSFWETIGGEKDFGGAGSLCHGWSAMPIYYFHLLGLVK